MNGMVSEKAELTLFRVIQEAVINVSKHASASNVDVELFFEDPLIRVGICDDGVGFDVDRVLKEEGEKGYGLMGLNERVEILDGTLEIESGPGKGTRITVNIPFSSIRASNV
jgi:two-component system sensor histidine kinase DegS